MQISEITPVMASVQAMDQIGVSVLSKSLDSMDVLGDGLQKMMEASVNPNLGQNIDLKV